MFRKFLLSALAAAVLMPVALRAQDFDARCSAILSRLQSMGHGYYSAQEWEAIDREVESLRADASSSRNAPSIIRAAVISAMVTADMRHLYSDGTAALDAAIKDVDSIDGADASPLYVKKAEILAEAGDAAGVQAVIDAYKASRHYKPQPLFWSGSATADDPLYIARPNSSDPNNSIPLSVMEKALVRAKSAPGVVFPDATLVDLYGNPVTLSSLRGKVVLVDFFARGWKVWEDSLPALRETYDRYSPRGFAVVSVCLESRPQGLETLALPWTLVPAAPQLTRPLGIFGDTTSYLLDQNGVVVARDLRGSDLSFAVSRLLGVH